MAVLGQRLLARICEACREEVEPEPGLVEKYFGERPEHPFARGRGCDACSGTGYRGLTGVFELLEVDRGLALAIGRGEPVEALAERAELASGFVSLVEHALAKVGRGETTLEEVARHLAPARRS